MKGDRIPESDYVARYCRPMQVCDGQIQATAFLLRDGEEGLSIDWLEIFKSKNREEEITQLRNAYNSRFSRIGANAKVAVLNVGHTSTKVIEGTIDKRKLRFLHDPKDDDISHSEITNLKPDNELIAELIVETIRETHPARS